MSCDAAVMCVMSRHVMMERRRCDARHVMSCDAAVMRVMSCHVMVERRWWRCAPCHVM